MEKILSRLFMQVHICFYVISSCTILLIAGYLVLESMTKGNVCTSVLSICNRIR